MTDAILVVNAGSSSIKFAVFGRTNNTLEKIYSGIVDHVATKPDITVYDVNKKIILTKNFDSFDLIEYEQIVSNLMLEINNCLQNFEITAIGHRVVHGGTNYLQPVLINELVIKELHDLIPLAPLHQPYNLKIIVALTRLYPNLKQVACFDTAFHATQNRLAQLFAIPRKLIESGVLRYGFHGLSYEYIASVLAKYLPANIVNGKIIVAHLGNGSSLCAMSNQQSRATSMGFTALDGLMMGTRSGRLDPGVVLYLFEQLNLSVKEASKLLYSESGLLGISGISSDVRELIANPDAKAKEAIDLFCYRAAQEIASLVIPLQGIEGLVFTAGIGEHAVLVRQKICDWLAWLGLELNDVANQNNENIISSQNSKVTVAVIPTNEELMIADHTEKLVF